MTVIRCFVGFCYECFVTLVMWYCDCVILRVSLCCVDSVSLLGKPPDNSVMTVATGKNLDAIPRKVGWDISQICPFTADLLPFSYWITTVQIWETPLGCNANHNSTILHQGTLQPEMKIQSLSTHLMQMESLVVS